MKPLLLALALTLVACSTPVAHEWRLGPMPTCDTTSRGRLLLMAQSVPEAALIPCIDTLPAGWEFSGASSRTDESLLVFTTYTFDLDVEVVLTPTCEASTAQPEESNRPGTELLVGSDGKTRYFAFSGGCITIEYETSELATSEEGADFMDSIEFMPRTTLSEVSGWTL